MKQTMYSRRMSLSLLAALIIISCSITGSPISTVSPEPTDTQAIQTEPATSTIEIVQETLGSEPSCTVLQDLNLRFGPGTAYRPPIRALPANSLVIPLGFAPQGIPGGSWAY